MTNEELTAAFPECERIKREQVAPFVEQVFNEADRQLIRLSSWEW